MACCCLWLRSRYHGTHQRAGSAHRGTLQSGADNVTTINRRRSFRKTPALFLFSPKGAINYDTLLYAGYPSAPDGTADDDPSQFQTQRPRPVSSRLSVQAQGCGLPVLYELRPQASLSSEPVSLSGRTNRSRSARPDRICAGLLLLRDGSAAPEPTAGLPRPTLIQFFPE